MHLRVALMLLLSAPGLARAQAQPGTGASWPLPEIGLPLAPIGLPLAPIGLPLAPLGLPPANPVDVRRPATPHPSPQLPPPRARHGRHARPALVYVVPPFWGWPDVRGALVPGALVPDAPVPDARPPAPSPATGTLRFDLEPPGIGRIYVDAVFVGTPEDFTQAITLEAGTHVVEIRAPRHRTVRFTARVEAGRDITYRDVLEPSTVMPPPPPEPDPPPPSAAPIARKPLYFIPGCYLGDVPPAEARLPATCDPARAITYRP